MTEEKPLPKSDFAEIINVTHVNFKPHPFMIGPRHFPKDGGMFIQPDQAPCAMRGCNLYRKDHSSDFVAFVKLTRNTTQDEMRQWLLSLTQTDDESLPWIKTHEPSWTIDGFGFVKSEFDFIPDPSNTVK